MCFNSNKEKQQMLQPKVHNQHPVVCVCVWYNNRKMLNLLEPLMKRKRQWDIWRSSDEEINGSLFITVDWKRGDNHVNKYACILEDLRLYLSSQSSCNTLTHTHSPPHPHTNLNLTHVAAQALSFTPPLLCISVYFTGLIDCQPLFFLLWNKGRHLVGFFIGSRIAALFRSFGNTVSAGVWKCLKNSKIRFRTALCLADKGWRIYSCMERSCCCCWWGAAGGGGEGEAALWQIDSQVRNCARRRATFNHGLI